MSKSMYFDIKSALNSTKDYHFVNLWENGIIESYIKTKYGFCKTNVLGDRHKLTIIDVKDLAKSIDNMQMTTDSTMQLLINQSRLRASVCSYVDKAVNSGYTIVIETTDIIPA